MLVDLVLPAAYLSSRALLQQTVQLLVNRLGPILLLLIVVVAISHADQLPPADLPITGLQPLRSAAGFFSADIDTLPRLQLPELNTAKLPAPKNDKGPRQIGIVRTLPESDLRRFDANNSDWLRSDDGRHLLGLIIESPRALALRLGLRVERLPPGAVLRFGSVGPDAPAPMIVVARDVLELLGINHAAAPQDPTANIYWSPLIEGERIAFELELPAGVEPSAVEVELLQLSHFYSAWLPQGDRLAKLDLGLAGSCHNDVMCSSADLQQLGESTAKITFQEGGASFVCSGNLLNDQDPSAGFHFLTANHCVQDQLVASTIEFQWLLRSSACSSATRDPGHVRQTGGALMLSTLGGNFDTTLLRLNQAPPEGVSAAGWDARLPTTGESLVGIHHPSGDWQKISFGSAGVYVDCQDDGQFFSCLPSGAGHFFEVNWSNGVIEGGSSGSGIFSAEDRLLGVLSSGNSTCSDPSQPAAYASFADAYVRGQFASWLMAQPETSPPSSAEDRARNLSTRGLIEPATPMHGGIVVQGDVKVLITARGPTTGLATALRDTVLQLSRLTSGQPPQPLSENDDWASNTNVGEIADLTTQRPLTELEAALLVDLSAGSYSALARDFNNDESGEVVLGFTVIDDGMATGQPKNLSTRGNVTPQAPMHGGIVIDGSVRVLVTARGPTTGLGTALADSRLELFRLNPGQAPLMLQENDDWGTNANAADIASLTVERALSAREAALLVDLTAGSYTAVVSNSSGNNSGEVVLGFTLIE